MLDIGRKGWVGLAFESTYGVPETIDDYVPFINNSLRGVQEALANEAAYGIREKVFNSVGGKRWGEGELEVNLDSQLSGYLIGGALGTVNTATVSGAVKDHTITRNNSSVPKSLTVVNDRSVDRQYFPGMAVAELEINVSDELATAKASLLGKFSQTTTSGTLSTASGGLYSFKDSFFAFGSTVAAAAAESNLKPSEVTLTINNNSEVVHRHGSADADTVNHKEFEVEAEGTLFFENTTLRDQYYNVSKRAAVWKLEGGGLAGGYRDAITTNMYQVRVDSHELETGLDDFFAEKFTLVLEYDNANSKSIDMVIRNAKASY